MTKKTKIDSTSLIVYLPSAIALAVIPALLHIVVVVSDSKETFRYFGKNAIADGDSYIYLDTYSQCKALAIVVFAVIMLAMALLFCVRLFRGFEKRTLVYVGAAAVFVIMSMLSAFGSEYRETALYGVYDRAEGFFTTACYFVLFLYSMYAFKTADNFKYFGIALFVCAGVNFIIGMLALAGYNLLEQDWFVTLITPRGFDGEITINGTLSKTRFVGALYHYNYVGSFTGLLIPLFTAMALFSKKTAHRIVYGIFAVITVIMLFASSARSGVVAVAAAVLVALFVFFRVILKRWKLALIIAGCAAAVVAGANTVSHNALLERIPTLFSDIKDFIAPSEKIDLYDTLPLREISAQNGKIVLTSQTDALTIGFDSDLLEYTFRDSRGNDVPHDEIYAGEAVTFRDERFKDFSLMFDTSDGNPYYNDIFFLWFYDNSNSSLVFNLRNEKSIVMINARTTERVVPVNAEHIGFEGKEKLGSSRGYIWSRTFPLLKNCLLTGYGADTFAYIFPQTDYLAKYYSYAEGFNIVVDKPHNLYIQLFFSHGLIALIAFLVIVIFYLADCAALYALKKEYTPEKICGIAVMLGIAGYLAAGLFNDSVVSVAPVFWILLGTGAALNTINRRADKAAAEPAEEPVTEDEPTVPESVPDDRPRLSTEIRTKDDLLNLIAKIDAMRAYNSENQESREDGAPEPPDEE